MKCLLLFLVLLSWVGCGRRGIEESPFETPSWCWVFVCFVCNGDDGFGSMKEGVWVLWTWRFYVVGLMIFAVGEGMGNFGGLK